MEFNEIIKRVLNSNNNLIFALNTKTKDITDVYKSNNKFKDNCTIDELVNIFACHFDLLNNHNDDLKKFLVNLELVEETFELDLNYEKKDGALVNIKFKAIPCSNDKILFLYSKKEK